jgi:hypothetical protein
MKGPDPKKLFAPIPLRAMKDHRFGLHARVLFAIAWHCRLHGRCWASHKTLCKEIGCDYTNISKVVRDLIAFGYIEREISPRNKKRRIYSVIHDFSWSTAQPSDATGGTNRTSKDSWSIDQLSREIVGQPVLQAFEKKRN